MPHHVPNGPTGRITLADAWLAAYDSIRNLQVNRTEHVRIYRSYEATLDAHSLRAETETRVSGAIACHRRLHELIDGTMIEAAAISPTGSRPPPGAWHYRQLNPGIPPMFDFGALEILANVLALACRPNWETVQKLSEKARPA